MLDLYRIALVWNTPVACDRASADYIISSPYMTGRYERRLPDSNNHRQCFEAEHPKAPVMVKGNHIEV